jgi:chromatin remodeling complex protein RSC6
MTKLTGLRQQLSAVMLDIRNVQKRADRELKAALKSSNKRKNKNATRAPSGFVKPTLISDQLADFLGKPHGSLLARTDVTREINAYIRANKLQDATNGRKIIPDAKLKKLLAVKAEDELTYFNLQKFMSQHFKKATPAAPVV